MSFARIILHLNFSKKDKATAYAQKLLAKNSLDASNFKIEAYHKFDNQFRASFQAKLSAQTDADKVYEILQLTNLLIEQARKEILVIGPSGGNESLEFETVVNCPEGIIPWAQFEIVHA